MDEERLLYLFREYISQDIEASSEHYVLETLKWLGATEDEIKYLKGEIK